MNRIKLMMFLEKNQIYQYQFAAALGVTESHLSKVLRGRTRPSPELVRKIAVLQQSFEK